MHIYVPALVGLQLRVQPRRRAPGVYVYGSIRACGNHAMPPLTTLTHDACSKPRRLGPGANAPTRREAGGSHAQTALTDTPAIYTSQGVCDITGRLTKRHTRQRAALEPHLESTPALVGAQEALSLARPPEKVGLSYCAWRGDRAAAAVHG